MNIKDVTQTVGAYVVRLTALARRWPWVSFYICVLGVVIVLIGLLFVVPNPKYLATFYFAFIWLEHAALGAGAGYAALRLWNYRTHPLIWRLAIYIHAFIFDALTSIALIFVARGVRFTWLFTSVMFVGTFLSDLVRAPLLMYLIKGPDTEPLPAASEQASGALPPDYWRKDFREAVSEGLEPIKARLDEIERKLNDLELGH